MTLVDKKKEGLIPLIERKAGLKMQRIGTPQPSDLARVAGLTLVSGGSGACMLALHAGRSATGITSAWQAPSTKV